MEAEQEEVPLCTLCGMRLDDKTRAIGQSYKSKKGRKPLDLSLIDETESRAYIDTMLVALLGPAWLQARRSRDVPWTVICGACVKRVQSGYNRLETRGWAKVRRPVKLVCEVGDSLRTTRGMGATRAGNLQPEAKKAHLTCQPDEEFNRCLPCHRQRTGLTKAEWVSDSSELVVPAT